MYRYRQSAANHNIYVYIVASLFHSCIFMSSAFFFIVAQRYFNSSKPKVARFILYIYMYVYRLYCIHYTHIIAVVSRTVSRVGRTFTLIFLRRVARLRVLLLTLRINALSFYLLFFVFVPVYFITTVVCSPNSPPVEVPDRYASSDGDRAAFKSPDIP